MHFGKNKFIGALAYLTGNCSSLHQLNVQTRGISVSVIDVHDKIQGFLWKLDRWRATDQKRINKNFPAIDDWKASKRQQDFGPEHWEMSAPTTSKINFDSFFTGAIFSNIAPGLIHSFEAKIKSIVTMICTTISLLFFNIKQRFIPNSYLAVVTFLSLKFYNLVRFWRSNLIKHCEK